MDFVDILASYKMLFLLICTHTFTLDNRLSQRSLSFKMVRISSVVISWFLVMVLSTSVSTFGLSDSEASVSVSVFGKFGDFQDSAKERSESVDENYVQFYTIDDGN